MTPTRVDTGEHPSGTSAEPINKKLQGVLGYYMKQ